MALPQKKTDTIKFDVFHPAIMQFCHGQFIEIGQNPIGR
jgi:hypothetical protein